MTDQTATTQAGRYSLNERAGQIMGFRRAGIPIDQPCELGYHCPVCVYVLTDDDPFDERLSWSEYNGFLWCEVCNKDYPSAFCRPDVDKAIDTFLNSTEDAQRAAATEKARADAAEGRLAEFDAELAKAGLEGCSAADLVRHHRNNEAATQGGWKIVAAVDKAAADAAESRVAALVEAVLTMFGPLGLADPVAFASGDDGVCFFCETPTDPVAEHDADAFDCPVSIIRALLADLAPAATARDAALRAEGLSVERIAAALLDAGLVTTLDVGRNWAPRLRDALLDSPRPMSPRGSPND
jgi:hypothetical protein